jgi:hypothetical protein
LELPLGPDLNHRKDGIPWLRLPGIRAAAELVRHRKSANTNARMAWKPNSRDLHSGYQIWRSPAISTSREPTETFLTRLRIKHVLLSPSEDLGQEHGDRLVNLLRPEPSELHLSDDGLDVRLGGRFGAIANDVPLLDHCPAPQPPPSRRRQLAVG